MNDTSSSKKFEKGAGFMRGVSHVTTSSPRCCGWETWEAARWAQIRPETDVPESAAVSRADLQTLCLPFPSYTASKTHNTTSKLSFKLIYNISQTLVRSSHLYISVQWITMNRSIKMIQSFCVVIPPRWERVAGQQGCCLQKEYERCSPRCPEWTEPAGERDSQTDMQKREVSERKSVLW